MAWPSNAPSAATAAAGRPAIVWVDAEEIARLAALPGRIGRPFSRRYVRRVGDRYSLIEKPGGDCIFWDEQAGCTVYPARPVQCRTWPFWAENIESPADWEHVRRVCPGSGRGQWFSLEQIQASARQTRS